MPGNPYNGFSWYERVTFSRAHAKVATLAGAPAPTTCSVCGRGPPVPIEVHAENYRSPLSVFPICRRCHHAIHTRFRRPDYWLRYIGPLDPNGWFRRLTLDPASLTRRFDETYPGWSGDFTPSDRQLEQVP
jgi:hypothetical protein